MATADVRRTKNKHHDEQPSKKKMPKKRRRGFRWGLLLFFVLLMTAVAFAPMAIVKTPLRDWLIASALQIDGTLTVGDASAGWFSGVSAEDVTLLDTDGEELLHLGMIAGNKPLVAMILDLADLGTIRVDRPTLHIITNGEESNLEQVLGPLLKAERTSGVAAQVQIVDGTVIVDDRSQKRRFRIRDLNVECQLGAHAGETHIALAGSLPDERVPASFDIKIEMAGDGDEGPLAHGKIDCRASDVPLELLQPLARRRIAGAQLAGLLTADLGGSWGRMSTGGDAAIHGQLNAANLVLGATAMGPDPIRLKRVDVPCQIIQRGDRLEIEQLELVSALGKVSLVGNVRPADLAEGNLWATLAQETYELTGHVDLARLAAMLPDTLEIRPGTEITAGQIDFVLSSRRQAGGTAWSGRLDASELAGEADGRPIVWEHPLSFRFKASDDRNGLAIERAECTSDFLQISASGSLEQLTANANFDLAQLTQQLKQFSDLKGAQLAGQGTMQLKWEQSSESRFATDADFQVRGFRWSMPQGRPWTEDRLNGRFSAAGRMRDRSLASVTSARLECSAPDEDLRIELLETVTDPWKTSWPLKCGWRGQLDPWAPRLAGALGLVGWDLGGTGALDAEVRVARRSIDIESASAEFAQLHAIGQGWFVQEPVAAIEVAGRWDLEHQVLELASGHLSIGHSDVELKHAKLLTGPRDWTLVDGTMALEVDLAQVYRWRQDPRVRPPVSVVGKLVAEARLTDDRGLVAGQLQGNVAGLKVVDLSPPTRRGVPPIAWQEDQVNVVLSGSFEPARRHLELAKFEIASDALRCNAKGTLNTANAGSIDVSGSVQYDWDKLTALWQAFVGDEVWIAGRQNQPFSIRGPLDGPWTDPHSWHRVAAQGAIGWKNMLVHGLRVGEGEIEAKLANGELKITPMDIPVNEAHFTFAPIVRLETSPAELLLSRGPLLSNIHMTPELSARALQFIIPELSDATVAEGDFSVALDGGRLPLPHWEYGDMSGRMSIRAQVKAGPVANEFFALISDLGSILKSGSLNDHRHALMTIDGPNVEFRVTNGRVYHRNLQITVGNLPITTYGSVGLVDESLALVAEMPMEAKLLGIDLSFGALEGQTIKIPIEGTLKDPKFDRRAMQHFTGQMLQNTARGAILDGVEKQLERLIPIR